MTSPNSDLVVVSVPPRPEHVHLLRGVLASVAARGEMPVDGIEELKIALDEACTHLLEIEGASVLRAQISAVEGGIEVSVSTDAEDGAWPPEGFEGSMTWQILTALTDDAAFEREGGPVLRFSRRIPEPADG